MNRNKMIGLAPVPGLCESRIDDLRHIKAAGFEATFFEWKQGETTAWKREADKLGLFVQSIHAPFSRSGGCLVSHLWEEGEEGVAAANRLITCVKDCADHDIPVMVIHPFIGFEDHTPTTIGLVNYGRVVEAAEKYGVKLGFENVEGEEYLAALMAHFKNSPACGFCLDTGHELCYNEGKDMLALYGDKLCHTHFNDNLGVYDSTLTWENDLHLVPGDGIVDFSGVMARIAQTPYEGPILFELSVTNKPGRTDHDRYRMMGAEGFYRFAYERAVAAVGQK